MSQICIRLREEDRKRLEELTARLGKNTTEVIRDLIQAGYDRQAVSVTLKEIEAVLTNIAAQKPASADVAEIKRIVTLIGRAMPAVSKHLT